MSYCHPTRGQQASHRILLPALMLMILLTIQNRTQVSAQSPRVYKDRIEPHWFADDTRFWYRNQLADGRHEFVLVNAIAGTRTAAFDHESVARQLSEDSGRVIAPDLLPITALSFEIENKRVTLSGAAGEWILDTKTSHIIDTKQKSSGPAQLRLFLPPRNSRSGGSETELELQNELPHDVHLSWITTTGERRSYGTIASGQTHRQHTFVGHIWMLSDASGKALGAFEAQNNKGTLRISKQSIESVHHTENRSRRRREANKSDGAVRAPDGSVGVFVKDHNLWMRRLSSESDQPPAPLTTDASEDNSFRKDASRRRLIQMQYNLSDPPDDQPDVRWSPDSAFVLAFQTNRVPERRVTYIESSPKNALQPLVRSYPYAKPGDEIPVGRPRLFDVHSGQEISLSTDLMEQPFSIEFLRWSPDSSRCWLLYNERGHQRLRVIEIRVQDGNVRCVVDEHSDTFIHYSTSGKFTLEWLPDSQLLWASERSGWNHLYRYDLNSGEVINAVTGGEWNVRRVTFIDSDSEEIWFYAVGVAPDQDPYHEHFCRVNFDGSDFRVLTAGDGTHEITFSPNRQFFVDRYSRVDLPPVSELRRSSDGQLVTNLETADASEVIAARGTFPRRFHAPGRDGHTEVWGIIHLPQTFDPEKQYPVVENIYAGPHDHHVPKAFRAHYRHQQQLADREMVVVQIDGMGTAWRSKAFHDVCYRNLKDAGFPDRIAWMQAAAEQFPWMDISRVGIYGGSAGGQNAMAALLWHGDFYKAAVADCGCHDNRMDKLWWNEQWMGLPDGDHYAACSNAENAERLQGKLMLVVGELDRNVDPASTTQVIKRLIEADKDFDFLLVPGVGHGACERPYASRRRADFLATHLQATGGE